MAIASPAQVPNRSQKRCSVEGTRTACSPPVNAARAAATFSAPGGSDSAAGLPFVRRSHGASSRLECLKPR